MKYILIILLAIATAAFSQEVPMWVCDAQRTATTNDTIVNAAGAIRAYPTNSVGSVIRWDFIVDTEHKKLFFDSVAAVPSGAIRVYYPTVKQILTFQPDGDEQTKMFDMGPTVGMSYADIFVSQKVINGGELRGNNTKDWSKSDGLKNWDIQYDTLTGLTKLNIGSPTSSVITSDDYSKLQISYTGTSLKFIKRVYSGLGIYTTGFYITDYLGVPYKGKQQSSDRVVMTTNPTIRNINCYTVSGDSSQIKFFNSTANFWLSAQFIK